MKLKARVKDQEHEIDFKFEDGRLLGVVDGQTHDVEVHHIRDHDYLIMENNRVYQLTVTRSLRNRATFEVQIRGNSYSVSISDPKKLRSGQNSEQHQHGSAEVLAPMPGKVVRVLVEPGAEIEKGAGVVVVEAMKMQNEMKSPRSGVVATVKVKPGDTVNSGDVLAIID